MTLRFTATIEDLNTKVWGTGLRVPVSIAAQIKAQGWKRLRCTFGGTVEKSTGMTAFDGGYYLILNQHILRSSSTKPGDPLEVEIQEDTRTYGTEMPDSLRQTLLLDPEADAYFHALTPGKQRNLIHIVQSVKSTDRQIAKALTIAAHLKEMDGKLDFKRLYAAFKL